MNERSFGIRGPLAALARLRGRPRLALLAAVGFAGVMIVALWLAASFAPPDEGVAEVELALPPPAAGQPPDVAAPQPAAREADPAEVRPGAGNALTVPPVAADAFAHILLPPRAAPLPPAPDPALVETTADGPLPKRGADGRLPWEIYARPFAAGEGRAVVAVVVTGLGRSATVTGEVIRRLPADVTLAFEPVADGEWARQARAAGHEIMLSLPVQGSAFPLTDRGPDALSADAGAAETRAGLHRLLVRIPGAVGAFANVGAEEADGGDAAASPALDLASRELAERGLLLVSPVLDKAVAGEAPQLGVDVTIGPDADAGAVRSRLADLEAAAAAKGYALAVVEPTPAAAGALAAWAQALAGKPVVLAPVSAVADAVQANAR